MKHLFLLLLFFGSISVTHVIAQSQQAGAGTDALTVAAKKAAAESGIIQKVSPVSGQVSYYRKDVCQKSGKVSLTEVQYCTKSSKFINAASNERTNCLKTKSDCVKEARTTETSSAGERSGDCTPAQKAACSSAATKTAAAKKAKA